ncbi:hypothetical protein BKA62DRAFT_744456 [Auriculariales sp. MPI-PUGE-AT-0066]|nr:hypothetical protein BKA62DRAFT_744456 [Auriculariales sp. MPI-PUGE-AT-0066]
MLVLSPESSCDICAESYNVESLPHSIPCGHTFCTSCLTKIAQGLWSPRTSPACPLCRESFAQTDIRLIRIDQAPSNAPAYPHVHPYPNYYPDPSCSSAAAAVAKFGTAPIDEDALEEVDDDRRVKIEAKRLEDKISTAAKKKCTFEEISSLQREVEQWLSKELQRRPDREHASLRLSAALLGAILVNGFAYNEAKKTAKGVEVTLKDRLDSAEQVKRKLEIELHKQRAQYTQKFFECQQLKQDLSRFQSTPGGSATPPAASTATSPAARPLGSSLATPQRPLTATPSRLSTPSASAASSRAATPIASRASTPAASPHYSTYSHFPARRPVSSTLTTAAENTAHLPLSALSIAETTAHLPVINGGYATQYAHTMSAPGSSTTSPERVGSQYAYSRWIPAASSRDEQEPAAAAAAAAAGDPRGRQRPASSLGSYGHGPGLARSASVSRPTAAATTGWRS